MAKKSPQVQSFTAIKVPQWLDSWDEIDFDPKAFQTMPKEHFYLLSLPASTLKSLTGVYRRSARKGQARAKDPNVQRVHQEERSKEISQFVKYGYPWCEMGDAKRKAPGAELLRKPGWLPTAIIVNILTENDLRNGTRIQKADLIRVSDEESTARIDLPAGFDGSIWEPESIYPLEVIDGQHRLWAFADFDPGDDFQLPVVAFHGLDRSWQAYLFWSVNITPKKINKSLAFDLYPLLRKEDWLDKFTGHAIYRETRSQELVEALWSHPQSPWEGRINMLGERKSELGTTVPMVTQAAWIRSLMVSFVKEWTGEDSEKIGGLFGAPRSEHDVNLPWNRSMQAAFLIYAGSAVVKAVKTSSALWAKAARKNEEPMLFEGDDAACFGKYSLLATDQGIRAFLQVTNDLCYVAADELSLSDWTWDEIYRGPRAQNLPATDEGAVSLALKNLGTTEAGAFLDELGKCLATYDWRTSATPGLTEQERLQRAAFRGSGGYKELRSQILFHIAGTKGDLAVVAKKAMRMLGYRQP